MWTDPELAYSYRVRDEAPDIALLGNVGVVQARAFGPAAVAELVEAVGADALCVHLNPPQELLQDEGERGFRGGGDTNSARVRIRRCARARDAVRGAHRGRARVAPALGRRAPGAARRRAACARPAAARVARSCRRGTGLRCSRAWQSPRRTPRLRPRAGAR